MAEAKYDLREVIAYIEPHIEQGPVLELEKLPVGIVTGIAGQTRAQFQFVGAAGHAGTVPMNARHDALVAAARLVTAVREIADQREGAVATVGQLAVAPNVANVIPGEVNLRLDVRHLDDDARDATFREITHQAAVIAEEEEVEFDMLWSQSQPSVKCHAEMIGRLEQSVVEAGIQPFRLPSGAGHDAADHGQTISHGDAFRPLCRRTEPSSRRVGQRSRCRHRTRCITAVCKKLGHRNQRARCPLARSSPLAPRPSPLTFRWTRLARYPTAPPAAA